jgi:Raf kinase inhibitor-like YbhB/YbcL family protein
MSLKIVSRAFAHDKFIPDKYTCNGHNVSPPLEWTDVPHAAKELVLIVDDPDAPSGTFVHWLLYGLQPTQSELDEDISTETASLPNGMRQGMNGFQKLGYAGPCPPSGTHRYYFHLYAVDSNLNLPPGAKREQVDQAIKNHVLEEAELMGYYAKK